MQFLVLVLAYGSSRPVESLVTPAYQHENDGIKYKVRRDRSSPLSLRADVLDEPRMSRSSSFSETTTSQGFRSRSSFAASRESAPTKQPSESAFSSSSSLLSSRIASKTVLTGLYLSSTSSETARRSSSTKNPSTRPSEAWIPSSLSSLSPWTIQLSRTSPRSTNSNPLLPFSPPSLNTEVDCHSCSRRTSRRPCCFDRSRSFPSKVGRLHRPTDLRTDQLQRISRGVQRRLGSSVSGTASASTRETLSTRKADFDPLRFLSQRTSPSTLSDAKASTRWRRPRSRKQLSELMPVTTLIRGRSS